MGIREAYGADPGRVLREAMVSGPEVARKQTYKKRVDLYNDNFAPYMFDRVTEIFDTPEVRDLLHPLIEMSGCNSILKRVCDEIGRPVYSRPPRRTVVSKNDGDQEAYATAIREMDLDGKMDYVARVLTGTNHVFLFLRVAREKLVLDVLTPDMLTLFFDPSDRLSVLGFGYKKMVWDRDRRQAATHFILWDEKEWIELNEAGIELSGGKPHKLGRVPLVEIHRRARVGAYWDTTTGTDLVSAQEQVTLLNALALKLHKAQGEKQLMVVGEAEIAGDQTLDGQGILQFPPGSQVELLDFTNPPTHYLETKREVEATVAANYGVSKARLNHESNTVESDAALAERTAEIVAVMKRAELDLFELAKAVIASDHPKLKLSEDAKLRIDFAPASVRVDRKQLLEIRDLEKKQGLRNTLDDILEDNPEVATDDEAMALMAQNFKIEALRQAQYAAVNLNMQADGQNPSQPAQANGAMGPAVRDKMMSKDAAADQAKKGVSPERKRQLLKEALNA